MSTAAAVLLLVVAAWVIGNTFAAGNHNLAHRLSKVF